MSNLPSEFTLVCVWDLKKKEGGIEPYSGLLEVALAGGYVTKPNVGWYARVNIKTGEIEDNKVREKDTLTKKFWDPIFKDTDFKEFVKTYYSVGHKPLLDIDLDIESEDV